VEKLPMMGLCRSAVRLMGLFFGCKASKGLNLPVPCNAGLPRLFLEPWLERNPLQAVLAGGFCVGPILSICRLPEVANAIIRTIMVYMVDLIGRLKTVMHFPCEPVRSIILSAHLDMDVPALVKISRLRPSRNSSSANSPMKLACFRVVCYKVLDVFYVHAYSMPGPEWDCQGRSG